MRHDDDVYLRAPALLAQLASRPPVRVWTGTLNAGVHHWLTSVGKSSQAARESFSFHSDFALLVADSLRILAFPLHFWAEARSSCGLQQDPVWLNSFRDLRLSASEPLQSPVAVSAMTTAIRSIATTEQRWPRLFVGNDRPRLQSG